MHFSFPILLFFSILILFIISFKYMVHWLDIHIVDEGIPVTTLSSLWLYTQPLPSLVIIFSNNLLKCSSNSSFLLSSLFNILMTVCLNSLSGKLLLSISLEFFYFLVPSFGAYFSVSPFCLTFSVCSYELDEIAISPSLEKVASV